MAAQTRKEKDGESYVDTWIDAIRVMGDQMTARHEAKRQRMADEMGLTVEQLRTLRKEKFEDYDLDAVYKYWKEGHPVVVNAVNEIKAVV